MFDADISGEVPEHRNFIYNKAIPFMQSKGLKVIILREPDKTYISEFTRKIKKGKHAGQIKSFPLCGHCNISRDLKFPIINRYKRNLPKNTKKYIGIAADEQNRLLRLDGDKISLLNKYHFTEHMAKQKCLEYGLLSPLYEFSDRGGCWFCPNIKHRELRHLYDHHKDLWQRMMELQMLPNKCTELFNRTLRFSDIDRRFKFEDLQQSLF